MRSTTASMIALAAAMVPQASRADVAPMARDVVSLQQPTSCQNEAAPNSDIVVLSTSGQAGTIVPFAIDERGISHLIPVSGGKGRDVTLVLGSQTSVVWDLRGVASGRVKAVYISGSGAQGVIGAPPTTKVEFSGDQTGYGDGCRFTVMATSPDSAVSAAMSVQNKFGRYPDRLFAGRAASAFDLDSVKAEVPRTADVKLADIRANRTLSPDTPAPAPLRLKKMIDDGSIRILDNDIMSQIRNAGIQITPIQAQVAPVVNQPNDDLLNRPGLTPQMRAAIAENMVARERSRAQEIARMSSYVPSSGIVVLKPIQSIPQMPGGDSMGAIFVPSDVTPPTQMSGRLYRLPMKASEVPMSSREGSSSSLTRMMEAQAGTQPDVAATWKGDSMTIRMPQSDRTGERRPISSAPIAQESEESSGFLIPLLGGALLACIGGMAFLLTKGRHAKRPSTTGSTTIGGAGDDDVLRQIHAVERTAAEPGLKEKAATFHAEVNRLAVRQDLDDDIAEKCGVLVEERFQQAAKRYLVARPTADAATGAHMDEAMSATIGSITASLREIGAEQDRRNIEAMTMSEPAARQDPGKPS